VSGSLFSQRFTGFGLNALDPTEQAGGAQLIRGRRSAQLRARARALCPRGPGVYGMIDARGVLIYVGKAKDLRARLLSYFRHRSRDPKAGRVLKQARVIAWEPNPTEFGALLRELELIQRWQPRWNVVGQPGRHRRVYVCLGRKPAPHVFLARRPPAGARGLFGPLPLGPKAQLAVRWLNDHFQLRDCPRSQTMIFADQTELFPVVRAAGCIRHEIGTCLGPCAALCTTTAYHHQLRAVRAFLTGTDRALLTRLQMEMTTAALAQEYEKAALIRDKLEALGWLTGHIDRVHEARTSHSFIYPVPSATGMPLWYLIHQGGVRRVVPAPTDPVTLARARAAVEQVYQSRRRLEKETRETIEAVYLVAAWFRRHPAERARTLDPSHVLATL
jgi:excinuclease ABC subunit C